MTSTLVVARKELLDLRRNRLLIVLLGFLAVAATVSVLVQAAQFRVSIDQYHQYVAALRASGSTLTAAPPQLFPLQLLRGSGEYIEVSGALFAIVAGYGVVAKEKQRATIELLFTRPVGPHAVAGGKILALATAWLVAVGGILVAITLALVLVGNAPLQPVDLARLALTGAAAWVYLVLWSCVAMGMASMTRRPTTGLIIVLVLWLVVVLVVPQIGDTMDPDNQVPGGLFKSLQIATADEHAVMAHFAAYDAVRNGLELSSVTKHVERLTFALLGIKDMYNQLPVAQVLTATLANSLSLLAGSALATGFAVLSTTRRTLLRRQS